MKFDLQNKKVLIEAYIEYLFFLSLYINIYIYLIKDKPLILYL